MALSSMTGFARASGSSGAYDWHWELKSVNAKGLDVRPRLPPGWDAIEIPLRKRAAEALTRGTLYAVLTVQRTGAPPAVRVNEPVLGAILSAFREISHRIQAAPPSLDGILGLKGVIDVVETEDSEEEKERATAAAVGGFETALAHLADMRRAEGAALARVLEMRLSEIADLIESAETTPGRRPEAVKARLAEQVAVLLESSERFDAERLHQEAILLAAKADIREELDRLRSHLDQARKLIAGGGAVGRKLDFLSQEFNREANTICAKSNDIALTKVGLELKSVVEQFREQVQNLE